MEQYGFADYASDGDVVGHTAGGCEFDDLLDARGLSGRSIIVFTADHGEMSGAHGLPI